MSLMCFKNEFMLQLNHPATDVRIARLWAWIMLATALGCGGQELGKVVVTGKVTFEGVPVENGEIRFYPTKETIGPVSGAPIVNGQFEAKAKGGVPLGTHQVQIRGYRAAGAGPDISSSPAAAPGDATGPAEQYLPAKYNDDSTLTLTVGSDANPLAKDFDLAP